MAIEIQMNTNGVTQTQTQPEMPEKKKKKFSLFKKKEKKIYTPEEEKKRKKIKIISRIVIFAVLAFVGGFYTYKAFQFSGSIGIKIKPQDIFNPVKKDPELKKDSTGSYTAALLVGIDRRNERSSLRNTDTMIIAVYNYKTADTIMLSVPRDLYVEVPGEGWYSKVNGIYAIGEDKEADKGLKYLEATLEGLTGIEIQYYAMIDLVGFKEVIDTVGGVTVNVENSFTDYQYPTEDSTKPMYEVVSFEEGPQVMDGETALKYARSRKSPDNNEGSDFARARRQQNVITAVKEKVLSSETLLNPAKILGIIDAIKANLRLSDFTLEEIQAGLNLATKQKEISSGSYSFVLDPTIGNYSVVEASNVGNLYVIIPKLGIGKTEGIKAVVQAIMSQPAMYSEKALVRVYDTGLGYYPTLEKVTQMQQTYPYLNISFMGTLFYDKEGTIIYSNVETGAANTGKELAKYLETELSNKPDYISNGLNGEDITIFFGKEVVESTPEAQ